MKDPTEEDEKRMRKVFRYYNGTRDFGMDLSPVKSMKAYFVQTYVDSDWAGDRLTRKSTTGVALNYGEQGDLLDLCQDPADDRTLGRRSRVERHHQRLLRVVGREASP